MKKARVSKVTDALGLMHQTGGSKEWELERYPNALAGIVMNFFDVLYIARYHVILRTWSVRSSI
jgi:hypothetical protein